MLRALLMVLIVATPLVGVQATTGCDAEAEVVREVRAVAMGIVAADNARDIERVLGYYAADAILLPPGEPSVAGRDAIRPRYERLFESFDPHIEARVDEACVADGLAVVRGHNGGTLIPRQGGRPLELDDAYLMVLRRERGGGWRITQLMWHRAR